MAQVHHNLTIGVELDVSTIHGARCRTLEIDSFSVVAAAMARALELAFAGDPVGSTAEMGADRGDHEDAFAVSHHPDSVLALELGIHAETEIGGVADLEHRIRLIKNPREEEAEKHQEVHAQCPQHRCRDEPAPTRNGHTQIGLFRPRED